MHCIVTCCLQPCTVLSHAPPQLSYICIPHLFPLPLRLVTPEHLPMPLCMLPSSICLPSHLTLPPMFTPLICTSRISGAHMTSSHVFCTSTSSTHHIPNSSRFSHTRCHLVSLCTTSISMHFAKMRQVFPMLIVTQFVIPHEHLHALCNFVLAFPCICPFLGSASSIHVPFPLFLSSFVISPFGNY